MAGYQRPGNQSGQRSGGYQGGGNQKAAVASTQVQAKPMQRQAPAVQQQASGEAPKGKGNKPKFRLAIVEDDGTGAMKTQKDAETGKTLYVGAAWENKYDGLNIKIEGDIPAGSVVRAYPVDDKPQG